MFSTVTIPIESKDDSSYEKASQQFMQSYYTEDKVILDLKNRHITQHQSALLFGRLLVTEGCCEVYAKHFRMEDLPDICHGIDDVFMAKFPNGITTVDGKKMYAPEIEITLPMGKIPGSLSLDLDSLNAIMLGDSYGDKNPSQPLSI